MIYTKSMEKLYTLPEIAEILKVSRKSVYRYIQSGKLKASKGTGQWRIHRADLDALQTRYMKKTTSKIKRLKPNEFLDAMKRVKAIDREMLALKLEREFLISQVKPNKLSK